MRGRERGEAVQVQTYELARWGRGGEGKEWREEAVQHAKVIMAACDWIGRGGRGGRGHMDCDAPGPPMMKGVSPKLSHASFAMSYTRNRRTALSSPSHAPTR